MIVYYIGYMPKNLNKTDRFIKPALEQVKAASDVHEMRMGLAILLVNQLRRTVEESAGLMGVSVPTVCRLRKEFQAGIAGKRLPRENWGGRRHSYMDDKEEKEFLSPFIKMAKAGELVVISSIQSAFEQKVGKEVPPSTITRLLERHRWRKIEPEPRHPNEDKAEQEAFKKKAFPKPLGRRQVFLLPPDPCA